MYEHNNYRAKVRRVVDGDTVDLDVDLGFHVIIRLRGRSSRSYRGSSRGRTDARPIILIPNVESLFRNNKRVLPIEQPKAVPKKVNGTIPIPWDNFLPVSLEYYS